MIKLIKIENIKEQKEIILDMIKTGVTDEAPLDMDSGMILGVNKLIEEEYSSKSKLEIEILLLAGILESAYGLQTGVFAEMMKEIGAIQLWNLSIELRERQFFGNLWDVIIKNAERQISDGTIISKVLYDIIKQLGNEIDKLNIEDINKHLQDYEKINKEMKENLSIIK